MKRLLFLLFLLPFFAQAQTYVNGSIQLGSNDSLRYLQSATIRPFLSRAQSDARYPAKTSTMYIGTTAHALNRASAAEGLAGITSLTPGADFAINQNSVAAFTSTNTGALVNTMTWKSGHVGIGVANGGYTAGQNEAILSIQKTSGTETSQYGIRTILNWIAQTAGGASSYTANSTTTGSVNNMEHLVDFQATNAHDASAVTMDRMHGLFVKNNIATGAILTLYNGTTINNPLGTGAIGTVIGHKIEALTRGTTANTGIHIEAPSGGITNIGLYNAGTSTLVGAITNAGLAAGSAGNFVVSNSNVLVYRTAAQVLSDIGGASASAPITLSAIGASPNANGATLTGAALNLEPASASFGGVVTTGTQVFAGQKQWNGLQDIQNQVLVTPSGGGTAFNVTSVDDVAIKGKNTSTGNATLDIWNAGSGKTATFRNSAGTEVVSIANAGTLTFPTPFTLGATSVTSTGTQLNYLAGATGTTGTATTNLVYSTSAALTTPTLTNAVLTGASTSFTNLTGSVQATISIATANAISQIFTLRNPNATNGTAGASIGWNIGTGNTPKSTFASVLTASGTDTRFAMGLTAAGSIAETYSFLNSGVFQTIGTTMNVGASYAVVMTFPTVSGTYATLAGTEAFTNKTYAGTSAVITAASADAITVRSGAAGSATAVSVGPTSSAGYFGYAGATNDFATGTAQGDVIVKGGGSTNTLRLIYGTTIGASLSSSGLTLPALTTAGLVVNSSAGLLSTASTVTAGIAVASTNKLQVDIGGTTYYLLMTTVP